MPDVPRFGAAKILQIVVPIVGVAIAVVSLLVAIASRKKELTCAYLGSEQVVGSEVGALHPDLKIDFHGEPVNSLAKMRFVVRNTGAGAIRAEDVKEPVSLNFAADAKILTSVVERTIPSPFLFRAVVYADQEAVICDFVLLNSGDEAYFAVYLLNSQPTVPRVGGRVVDVRRVSLVDESTTGQANPFPFASNRGVRKVMYWSLVAFNAALSIFFLGILLAITYDYLRYRSWQTKWKKVYDEALRRAQAAAEPDPKAVLAAGPALDLGVYAIPSEIRSSLGYGKARFFAADLKQKGIPSPPNALNETLTSYLGTLLVLGGFFLLFTSTACFILLSPKGY